MLGGVGGLAMLALALVVPHGSLAQTVTPCVGSNRDECIDMDKCVVNIGGSNYDLSPLKGECRGALFFGVAAPMRPAANP